MMTAIKSTTIHFEEMTTTKIKIKIENEGNINMNKLKDAQNQVRKYKRQANKTNKQYQLNARVHIMKNEKKNEYERQNEENPLKSFIPCERSKKKKSLLQFAAAVVDDGDGALVLVLMQCTLPLYAVENGKVLQ